MEVVSNNYMPGDPRLIDHIVYELKSQGIFDNFRKECIADVDTKPAYQNLRQRVEGSVSGFLKTQKWRPDMNKNQVREMLRKNISESGFLETGVERIVDQVVNPKINSIFLPQVENVVYKYLGIQKPSAFDDLKKQVDMNMKPVDSGERLDLSNNLLPSDLETVSPASETQDKKLDTSNESQKLEDRMDEDESPPFEPLEESASFVVHEENSVDSHLSGFSGLASHDSNHSLGMSNKITPMEISNQDSQLSKPSSDDHLSIVMSDDVETKIEINEDSTHSKTSTKMNEDSTHSKTSTKMNEDSTHSKTSTKITDTNSKSFDFMQDRQPGSEKSSHTVKTDKTDKVDDSKKIEDKAKSDDKKSDKHRSSHKHKSRQDSRDHKNEKDRKSDKDKKDREKSGHSSKDRKDKDKERKDRDSKSKDGENKSDRDRSKSSSSKHSSSRDKSSSKKDSSENKTKETSEAKDLKSSEHKDAKQKEDSKLKMSKEKSENSKSKSESKSHNSSKSKGESKSYSKHNGKSSKPDLSDSSRSSSKSSNKKDEKSHRKEEKHQSRSDKHSSSSRKDDKHEKDKRDSKKDSKKETKDDHYSLKGKKSNRRSTDRDSSDGHSGTHSSSSSFADLSVSSQLQKSSQDSSVANSGSSSGDSGNSDQVESTTEKSQEAQPTPAPTIQQLPQVKLIKPKFASNIFEARRLMKIRKKLGKLEKRNQMELMNSGVALNNSLAPKVDKKNEPNHILTYEIVTVPDEPEHNENLKRKPNILKKQPNILKTSKLNSHSKLDTKVATPQIPKDKIKPTHSKAHEHKKDEIPKHSARKHLESKVDDDEEENVAEVVEISDDSNTTPLFNSVISKESWDAIEAKLNSENALNVDYNAYTDLSEEVKEPEEKVVLPVQAENITSKAEEENCLGFEKKLCIEAQKHVDMMCMSINWLEEDVADRSKIQLSRIDRRKKQADVNKTENAMDGLGRRLPKVAIVDVTADSEIIISPRKGIKRHAEDHPDVHNNNKTNKLDIDIVDERLNHVADKINQPMKTTASKVKKAKIVDSSVNQLENFNLPLSPADSDKSFTTTGDKKNGKVEAKKRTISNRALKSNQRYSSDDLYKPRLQFSSTRRRATKNSDVN